MSQIYNLTAKIHELLPQVKNKEAKELLKKFKDDNLITILKNNK